MSTPASVIAAQIRDAFALHNQGQLDAAAKGYTAVLAQAPRNFTALHLLGVIHLQRGENAEAESFFSKALKVEPKDAAALSNRGLALRALGQLDEALMSFNKSAAFNPKSAETQYNRALTLHDLRRDDEALAAFDKALALKPDYADAHSDRGDALAYLGRYTAALEAFDAALALRPEDARTLHNKGHALKAMGRYADALATFERAIAQDADIAPAYLGRAECLLVQGDFANGWPAYEQWVDHVPEINNRVFTAPRWRGDTDFTGKTILLHAEQGLGDTIQFARYAPQIAAMGAHVILEVQPPLSGLIGTLDSAVRVVARGSELPHYDFQIPLMNLPPAFGTDVSTIPAPIPYLAADPARSDTWRARLSPDAALRVGLVWSGNPAHRNDRIRSIPLQMLAPVLADRRIEFIALQTDIRASDQKTAAQMPQLKPWGHELRDFAETAALVAALDLVITVDTSVAHLAGALGKPVWILLSYAPDWRWLLARTDSPWYPTARLFRQPAVGDWQTAIANVATELAAFRAPPAA